MRKTALQAHCTLTIENMIASQKQLAMDICYPGKPKNATQGKASQTRQVYHAEQKSLVSAKKSLVKQSRYSKLARLASDPQRMV